MISAAPPLLGLVASLSAWIGAAFGIAGGPEPVVQRLIIRDAMVIHVPIAHRPLPLIEWVERKGPKCLPAAIIAGASMAGPSTIDFVLRDRRRVRAQLDSDCQGLDFYGGFYVEPDHGRICAKREEIRSRVGATCRIERFRNLVPRVKR